MTDLSVLTPALREAITATFPGAEVALEPLRGGFSTASLWKVTSGSRSCVVRQVRIDDPAQDPERQFTCMKLAAEHGLAPPVLYANVATGICVTEFVESTPWVAAMRSGEATLERLAVHLRALHEGPAFPRFVSLPNGIRAMQSNLVRIGVSCPRREELAAVATEIEAAIQPHVIEAPCHHDLNPGNILVGSKQLWLIDWELAGQGDPYDDLAGFGAFALTNARLRAHFHGCYLGRDPTVHEADRMQLARVLALSFYATGFFSAAAIRSIPLEAPSGETLPDIAGAYAQLAARGGGSPTSSPAWFGRVLAQQALSERAEPAYAEALNRLTR